MNFFTKALLKAQLKNVPKDQQEMIMALVEKNPKLFTQISKEIKEKQKKGLDQQVATMQVMMAHKNELQQLVQQVQRK
ncbi:hypothetical protein H6775_02050 [Candidatus Nomurabacteria bacterium]|nr:hypothetical protein [Candidatus Nomurabacteria bacterium]